jgi:dTDP-4-amino-4,6-dideoxygalactose transaminase
MISKYQFGRDLTSVFSPWDSRNSIAFMMKIPFNRPYHSARAVEYSSAAVDSDHHCGSGAFSRRCEEFLKMKFDVGRAFLTPSATAALEMASILAEVAPGDEVIVPSYAFSSTANAFCLRGAVPVFADIHGDTLVLDPKDVERKITKKTKAIVPINYGGVSADLDTLNQLASNANATLIEDAAQGIGAKYKGRHVGSIAPISVFSFHETKNVSCGEGGALLLNNLSLEQLAQFAQEKGTDRSLVISGLKSKYSWVALGSSYLLAEPLAGILLSQLEEFDRIRDARERVFRKYREVLGDVERKGRISLQRIPSECETNFHAFFIIFEEPKERTQFIRSMGEVGISCYIGYLALHSSSMGKRFGGGDVSLPVSERIENSIVRLPFYADMTDSELNYVAGRVEDYFKGNHGK